MCDDLGDGAVLAEQIGGLLGTDAGDADDIVHTVADEHLGFDGLIGTVALFLDHRGDIDDAILAGVEHEDMLAEQLIEVLVATDEVDVEIGGVFATQCRQDVIRLVALLAENRHLHGLEYGDDAVDLRREIFRRRLAVALVARVEVHTKDGLVGDVHRHGQIVGLSIAQEAQEHLQEYVDRARLFAGRRGQRAEGCIIGAVDLSVAIDEVEGFSRHFEWASRGRFLRGATECQAGARSGIAPGP